MSRIKPKTIIWYYFRHFLFFFGVFTLLEIVVGGFIFFGHMDNTQTRNHLYYQWSSVLMGLQNIVWFVYLSIINYRAGDKYGNRAFLGLWIWLACFGIFFFYDLFNYNLLDLLVIKTFITLLTLPAIFIGSYKRKKDIERFNISHNLSARDKK